MHNFLVVFCISLLSIGFNLKVFAEIDVRVVIHNESSKGIGALRLNVAGLDFHNNKNIYLFGEHGPYDELGPGNHTVTIPFGKFSFPIKAITIRDLVFVKKNKSDDYAKLLVDVYNFYEQASKRDEFNVKHPEYPTLLKKHNAFDDETANKMKDIAEHANMSAVGEFKSNPFKDVGNKEYSIIFAITIKDNKIEIVVNKHNDLFEVQAN